MLAIGFIIKKSSLAPNSSIVEFGPRWGNTTLAFSQMGYKIACVEVENRFIDLIKYRTRDLGSEIDYFNGGMLDFTLNTKKQFDAAVFFESFHHCDEPMKLLEIYQGSVKDNGIICFASEPLVQEPSEFVPYPWGVRLDGMSLWSIRKFGWMELGFEKEFFLKTLSMYGVESTDILFRC